jgi:hypothetical protein
MNGSHYPSLFDKMHIDAFGFMFPRQKIKDAFIRKKLSDYYFSKLIPDFFYHTPLSNNYYPTVVATRVTLSLSLLLAFSYYMYRKRVSEHKDYTKKYPFTMMTKKYILLEKETIISEKDSKRKIFIN